MGVRCIFLKVAVGNDMNLTIFKIGHRFDKKKVVTTVVVVVVVVVLLAVKAELGCGEAFLAARYSPSKLFPYNFH